jgi:hypothetical protein
MHKERVKPTALKPEQPLHKRSPEMAQVGNGTNKENIVLNTFPRFVITHLNGNFFLLIKIYYELI